MADWLIAVLALLMLLAYALLERRADARRD
jgi:hypothetical protein